MEIQSDTDTELVGTVGTRYGTGMVGTVPILPTVGTIRYFLNERMQMYCIFNFSSSQDETKIVFLLQFPNNYFNRLKAKTLRFPEPSNWLLRQSIHDIGTLPNIGMLST